MEILTKFIRYPRLKISKFSFKWNEFCLTTDKKSRKCQKTESGYHWTALVNDQTTAPWWEPNILHSRNFIVVSILTPFKRKVSTGTCILKFRHLLACSCLIHWIERDFWPGVITRNEHDQTYNSSWESGSKLTTCPNQCAVHETRNGDGGRYDTYPNRYRELRALLRK